MRQAAVGAIAGIGLLFLGGAFVAFSAAEYLGSPQTLDSFSGNPVFTVDGRLVQYPVWTLDALTVGMLAAGLVVFAASLVLMAITWRPQRVPVH